MANCVHHQPQLNQAWTTYQNIKKTVENYATYKSSLEEFKTKISNLSSFVFGYASSLSMIGNYLVYVGINGQAFDKGDCFNYAKTLKAKVETLTAYSDSLQGEIDNVESKRSELAIKETNSLRDYNAILYSDCPICSQNPYKNSNPNSGYRGGRNPYSNVPAGATMYVNTPYGRFSSTNSSTNNDPRNRQGTNLSQR